MGSPSWKQSRNATRSCTCTSTGWHGAAHLRSSSASTISSAAISNVLRYWVLVCLCLCVGSQRSIHVSPNPLIKGDFTLRHDRTHSLHVSERFNAISFRSVFLVQAYVKQPIKCTQW